MTGQPLIRYVCDRCGATEEMGVDNRPPQERIAGPETWLMLHVGSDPSTPPTHLCTGCQMLFGAFMQGTIT